MSNVKKKNKVLLIYNPNAGNGMIRVNLDRIIAAFHKKKIFVWPLRIGRPSLLAAAMQELRQREDFLKVIAAGGDGTINTVVNAMMKAEVNLPLAVFPTGTANDFASYFDLPTDIDGMIQVALEENYICCDVGLVNNEKYFVNVAAMGHLVDVSQKTDPDIKNTLGVISYYLRGVTELPKMQPIPIRIRSAEVEAEELMFFMLVMNGRSAGGFRRIGAISEINDGLLDVMVFREMPVTEMPLLIIAFAQGNHLKNKNVLYFQTSHLIVEADQKVGTDVDGEKGCAFPLDIRCLPSALNVNIKRSDMPGSGR
ncbi:MAG TPA: YegS/Rv2252/BmrU family lipid kinase [Clostridiales bacterium]|nr:YegS/Rv2252/BmrU family lipid kinase [Clostridiales bacterium]